MKKFLIAFLAFYLGIIVFMPKKELFYTAQKYLSSQNIYINAKVESNIISLILKDAKVYVQLLGSCVGCAASSSTLKFIVEKELKTAIHPELVIINVPQGMEDEILNG